MTMQTTKNMTPCMESYTAKSKTIAGSYLLRELPLMHVSYQDSETLQWWNILSKILWSF